MRSNFTSRLSQRFLANRTSIVSCSVVRAELLTGAYKSSDPARHAARVEALLARQDDAGREHKVELDRIAKVRHQHYLDKLTLDVLREEQPFADWDRLWTAAIISRARNIFRDTIDELISLGPRPTLNAARPILRACIEQFNELNGTGDFVIETDEREDICKHFRLTIHAAGLAGDTPIDLEDEWRQW